MNLSTSQNDQWVGSAVEIEKALTRIGADLDQTGKFRIDPPNQAETLFGSEEDILVTRDVLYFYGRIPMRLADLMIQETGHRIVFNQKQ
jgi:hypothetical protein